MGCAAPKPTFYKPDWWLFTSDKTGELKQFCVPEQALIKNYGKVHKAAIKSIAASYDGKHLFTADDKGNLIQWDIDSQTLVKDYGQMHNAPILSMVITPNCENLFTGAENGYLKQFSVSKQKLLKSYDKCHKAPITAMASSNDGKYIFTCCLTALNQWSVSGQKCLKNFAEALGADLAFNGICVSPCSKFLYSFDWDGEIKKWSISGKKVVGSMPKCDQISGLVCTNDSKW
jgi:WD40 repeat protein